ncbi:MAG: SGNH/GDSL hydrolase family protein [Puia sp.]|nr:SGNH/GDSL hydrolase family protein [Puia sp.]
MNTPLIASRWPFRFTMSRALRLPAGLFFWLPAIACLMPGFAACGTAKHLPVVQYDKKDRSGVNEQEYLSGIRNELKKEWPANRTINLVFHGHSVPSGYARTPMVNTFDSYPYLFLQALKAEYPYAVVNIIVTAKGGENSESGAARFEQDVLIHRPDVVFIDYALNDFGPGLERSRKAWSTMIEMAKKRHIPVILLTPSPDLRVDFSNPGNDLQRHTDQIKALAKEYHTGLVNSFGIFKSLYSKGDSLKDYMSQVNHPNKAGNQLIADEIMKWFR